MSENDRYEDPLYLEKLSTTMMNQLGIPSKINKIGWSIMDLDSDVKFYTQFQAEIRDKLLLMTPETRGRIAESNNVSRPNSDCTSGTTTHTICACSFIDQNATGHNNVVTIATTTIAIKMFEILRRRATDKR